MLGEEDSLGSQFPLLPEVFPPPKEGMNPEDPEDGNQEAGHKDEGSVKDWLSLRIIVGRMSTPLNEVNIGPSVAFSAGLYQTFLRNERLGVIGRQNVVKTMTVCTTRHQCRVSQFLNLPVVTFIIGLRGNKEDLVPFHHLLVGMALLTDLCMELFPGLYHFGLITF
jgi:hypothetical protein